MKICALMFYDDNIKDYAEINYSINQRYCKKYGIDLILEHNREYIDGRHPSWEKLPLILKNIDKYEYVIWIDADAFFYDDAPNIIDLIEKYKEANIIFSNDLGDYRTNCGVLIIKNTEYSKNFIDFWAYDKDYFDRNPYPVYWEQGVMIQLYEDNKLDIKNNCVLLNYGIIQSFNLKDKNAQLPFIYHAAGKTKEERMNVFSTYYKNLLSENGA